MREPGRLVLELACDQPSSVRSQAELKFTDFRDNLVNMERRFVTETLILRDAIETGERIDAINHIAVHIVNVRDR